MTQRENGNDRYITLSFTRNGTLSAKLRLRHDLPSILSKKKPPSSSVQSTFGKEVLRRSIRWEHQVCLWDRSSEQRNSVEYSEKVHDVILFGDAKSKPVETEDREDQLAVVEVQGP